MQKIRTNLAYTGGDGNPVLSQSFALDAKEAEVSSLHGEVVAEGYGHIEAGALAVVVLPAPDPEFFEFLTGGTLTLDANGRLSGDPGVIEWVESIKATGRVW